MALQGSKVPWRLWSKRLWSGDLGGPLRSWLAGGCWGAPPDLCPPYTGLFQHVVKSECRFINGTDQARLVVRFSYSLEQLLHLDSKVGPCMGDTLYGEKQARYWNTQTEFMEEIRAVVGTVC